MNKKLLRCVAGVFLCVSAHQACAMEERIVRAIKKRCITLQVIENYELMAQEAYFAGMCGNMHKMNHVVRNLGAPIDGGDSLTQATYKLTIDLAR